MGAQVLNLSPKKKEIYRPSLTDEKKLRNWNQNRKIPLYTETVIKFGNIVFSSFSLSYTKKMYNIPVSYN